MCGIVGIVASSGNVSEDLLRGITRLEYRGYDSCGIAVKNGTSLKVSKEVGGPSSLTDSGIFDDLDGSLGIAHTRWATHGGVSRANAHPHLSSDEQVAIVHNGVLLNYRELRKQLQEDGHEFSSETDSEISANLIARNLRRLGDPRQAVLQSGRELEGTYALAVIFADQPNRMWAMRQESPLVVGFKNDQVIVASDPLALGSDCSELMYVEDGELVEINGDQCQVYRVADGQAVERSRQVITSFEEVPELGEFQHFMAKEMSESATAARAALMLEDDLVADTVRQLLAARRCFLTGMGTAYHMAYFGHYLMATMAKAFFPMVTSDELPSVVSFGEGDCVLGVSQSGETYDTLRALRIAKQSGAKTFAVCNVSNSSMAREVDQVLLQAAGPEVAVLATKSALSQAIILARIAIEAGRQSGALTAAEHITQLEQLRRVPDLIEEWRERD